MEVGRDSIFLASREWEPVSKFDGPGDLMATGEVIAESCAL